MGDSPFGKRFILLFYLSLVAGHSIRVKLDNPSKCYSQISTITRSSCSCSAKAHQDSRPIALSTPFELVSVGKREGEGE